MRFHESQEYLIRPVVHTLFTLTLPSIASSPAFTHILRNSRVGTKPRLTLCALSDWAQRMAGKEFTRYASGGYSRR